MTISDAPELAEDRQFWWTTAKAEGYASYYCYCYCCYHYLAYKTCRTKNYTNQN